MCVKLYVLFGLVLWKGNVQILKLAIIKPALEMLMLPKKKTTATE